MSVDGGCCGGCLQKGTRTEISRIDTLPVVKVSENREKFCRSVAEEGKLETLKSLLLLKKTFNIDATDETGETPLHKAARMGRLSAIQLLIENGADRGIRNSKGQTALDLARGEGGDNAIADYLASTPEVPKEKSRMRGMPGT